MTADERRRKAIYSFYDTYREYKQLDNVRFHTCVQMSGDTLIEIHRYHGDRKEQLILRVALEESEGWEVSAEVAAYERAASRLSDLVESMSKNRESRRRA